MRVLNFGSLNFDHVYEVEHFVRPGETITSDKYHLLCGGKGLNQSIALARAGANVFHAGKIGRDGELLVSRLKEAGVDTTHVGVSETAPTGHAVIQVNAKGENSIIIHGGANREIRTDDVNRVLAHFNSGDCLLLQNEISSIPEIIKKAKQIGMTIVLNPAPMDKAVLGFPLTEVDYFVINVIEGRELAQSVETREIVEKMLTRFPHSATLLTLGEHGAIYADHQTSISVPAEKVIAVDTTAAGDTFIGYFLTERLKGQPLETCLMQATRAAAICVTRRGAADSIPRREEVISVL